MTPARWWAAWSFDPGVLAWLIAAVVAYVAGVRRLRIPPAPRRQASYYLGLGLFAVALVSPLDRLGHELFVAHMTQHLLLGLIAPLLVVAAHPGATFSRLVPDAAGAWERRWWRWRRVLGLGHHRGWAAVVAAGAHATAMWVWHLPALYDVALRHSWVHVAEHASFVLTGLWLWSAVLGPVRIRWRSRVGGSILALFVAGLGTGSLAALLTLAPSPLYQAHLGTTAAWGLSPLEDQQLAGAVMWVPGGITYALAAIVLLIRWLEAGPARHAALAPDAVAPLVRRP